MRSSVFNNPMLGAGLSELVKAFIGDPEQELRAQGMSLDNQLKMLRLQQAGIEGGLGSLVRGSGGGSGGDGGVMTADGVRYTPKAMTASDLNNIEGLAKSTGQDPQILRRRTEALIGTGMYPSWSAAMNAALDGSINGGAGLSGVEATYNLPGDSPLTAADLGLVDRPIGGSQSVGLPVDPPIADTAFAPLGDVMANTGVVAAIPPAPKQSVGEMNTSDVTAALKQAADMGVDPTVLLGNMQARVANGESGASALAAEIGGIIPGKAGGRWPWSADAVPPTLTPYAGSQGIGQNDPLAKARAAIAAGRDPALVRQRLIDSGIDPSGL